MMIEISFIIPKLKQKLKAFLFSLKEKFLHLAESNVTLTLLACNQNAEFIILNQFEREIPASRQKQKRVIYHNNCQIVKDVITPLLISDGLTSMRNHLTNQRARNCVRGMQNLVKSKSDSHNPEEEASVVLIFVGKSVPRKRCALDSILVNLNKTI